MKKLLILLLSATNLSVWADDKIVITQTSGRGSGHDQFISVMASGMDKSDQKYEHIVGKTCVNAVQAWNDAKDKQPIVMVYSSPHVRSSVTTGIPCIADTDNQSIKVLMAGSTAMLICGHKDSKPINSQGIKFSAIPAFKDFGKIVNTSGYYWKFIPGTSNEVTMMLSNGDIDYGVINAATGEKFRNSPRVKCMYSAGGVKTEYPDLDSVLNLKYSADSVFNTTVLLIAKNLSPKQEALLAKIINAKNPEYVNGVAKHYRLDPMPKKGQDVAYLKKFINTNMATGNLIKSMEAPPQ